MKSSLSRLTPRSVSRLRVALRISAVAAVAVLPGLHAMAQGSPKMTRKQKEEVYKPTGPVEQQFPFGATWILSDMGGRTLSGDAPSFSLDDKLRATGFGGCNTFSMALYPIKEQKLAAGSIAMTRKTCGKPIDDTEHDLLVGLHSLPKWHLEPNGDLTVVGQGPAMRFKRGL